MTMWVAQWQDTNGVVATLTQAAYDTEAQAQAKADQLIDTGHDWVVVYEGPEVGAA